MRRCVFKDLFFIFFIALFFFGCSEESIVEKGNLQLGETVSMNILARAGTDTGKDLSGEDSIESLRLIAYPYVNGTYGSEQLANVYKTGMAGANTYQLVIQIPKKQDFRIFVIANEKAEWMLADPTMNADQLKNKLVDYLDSGTQLNIQPAFPMYVESETITSDVSFFYEVSLERIVAKISLSLKGTFADIAGLNNGTLNLIEASVQRVPQNPVLAPVIPFHSDDESDYVSTIGKPIVLQSLMTGGIETGFQTQPGDELIFYLPEHIINNKDMYTFIQIDGQYTPQFGSAPLVITYRIPVGNGVKKLYETPGMLSIGDLTPDDLTITRNNHYRFDANIRSLGEYDGMQLFVKAEPWKSGETVDGSVATPPYLNVSSLKASLVGNVFAPEYLYFWSNQEKKEIKIAELGKDSSGASFLVEELFDVEFSFIDTYPTNGSIKLSRNELYSFPDGEYRIYLDAGGLKREIKIMVSS